MRYCNYHRHSQYSNLSSPDSTLTINDYLKRAKELNHTSLSVVEHGYCPMTSILEAYSICKNNNMKLLIGAEAYFVNNRFEKDRSNYHIVLMALNEKGRKQLNLVISEANMTGFYHKARLDRELISKLNKENFIITTACVAGVGNDEDIIRFLKDKFQENLFLEIQAHNHPTQIEYNKKMLYLHNKYNIELIHGCDTHYITEQDKFNRNIFLKGKKMNYGDEDSFEIDYPSYEEILERYKKQEVIPEHLVKIALENTMIIESETEEFIFKDNIKMPTLFPSKTHEQKIRKLKSIINNEFKKQYPDLSKEEKKKYQEALKFEMNIIEETSMEDYFLDNYYIIKRAKELGGILTQTGRGSGVSFLINKILGFTNIDRLQEEIELYPTRFMSKSRILETRSLPDIDHNLVAQEPFVKATREILGEQSCYVMISYGYQMERAGIKNVCRALNIPAEEQNMITKNLEESRRMEKYKDVFKIADNIGSVIESASPNPCGHLLLTGDIREEIGIIKIGDTYCCTIDKNTADKWKYLKNDYLLVSVWLLISEVYKELNKPIDSIKDLKELTMNNEKVWKLYEDGITATLNQTSTQSGKQQVMIYKPKNIEELSHFVAGIRPSFESMKSYLLNRKEFSYNIPEFDKLLQTSMNFVLYQENIMTALVYAGIPEDETYGIIKAISKKKKEIIMNAKDRFIKGFTEKTGSEENAEKVWQIIEDASAYGFNSSHSLSVAYDSLYGAYLKATYPVQYYSVALNINEGNELITHDLTEELKYFNITLTDIKFGKSRAKYTYDLENKEIYKGIASIKYMNEVVSEELFELSKNNYDNFVDLLVDITEKTSVNSRQIKILIKLDFFSMFGRSKFLLDTYEYFTKKYKKTLKDTTKLKRIELIKEEIKNYENKDLSVKEILETQAEYLGYLTYKNESIKKDIFYILSIEGVYTNKLIRLYSIKDGITYNYKINKRKIQELGVTDKQLIRVLNIESKPKNVLINGKWQQDYENMESYIDSLKILKS